MKSKPNHYRPITVTLYVNDLTKLDTMVDELKARGVFKASRSGLIRYALEKLTPEQLDTITRKDILQ